MTENNCLYAHTRENWRAWLQDNYQSADEIWLVYPRKHSNKPRIPYNDAVEEALCFGWIDSITKGIDADTYSQRFSPRKVRGNYSQTNIERLRYLLKQGLIMPELLPEVEAVLAIPFSFPQDIKDALYADRIVWNNFNSYSEAYQRIRVAYVETRRNKPAEFEKRLNNLIEKTRQNMQFGFGIEKYY